MILPAPGDPLARPAATAAIVIPSLGLGGAERVALWLAVSLQRCGDRVLLLTQLAPESDVYALPAGLERHVLGPQPWHWGWRPFGKYLGHGASLRPLRRLLQRERVDVALAFMPHASVKTVLACIGLPLRVVVTERNAPWRRQLPWGLDLLRRLFYRCAAAQVVQTEPIAAWFHRHAACRRLAVIPNAVQHPLPVLRPSPAGAAPPIRQLGPQDCIPAGRLLLLAAGTKPHQKGFDLLLEAFEAIAPRHPDWDLAIVGLDPQRIEAGLSAATLHRRAHAAGLATRVHVVGPVADMAAWYARADCFVLSSRFEGIPNVLLEAMAAGCACLAADCPTGPRELIEHGVNGLLVPAGSIESLATGLDQLMADPSQRATLAARAPGVRQRFAADVVLQRWCEVLGV
ncbi:glycosyltransferase [Cyanobium sp. Aljojuca 7D2]|uniref:glycosyltransferase n=1 Tax=Cyanobium sp. Aljojuca 7D2 TaxID=2823698 RepID=UPI0020CFB3BC|nr:glycosyltransferase [Cyanobium sp. Aljojuca 7D2]MCP9890284.1 glycosyltransferase [Cyanobium sp. Aljojuca 7D2]